MIRLIISKISEHSVKGIIILITQGENEVFSSGSSLVPKTYLTTASLSSGGGYSPPQLHPHQHAAGAQNSSPCAHWKPSCAFQFWIHWPFLSSHWEQLSHIPTLNCWAREGGVDGDKRSKCLICPHLKKSSEGCFYLTVCYLLAFVHILLFHLFTMYEITIIFFSTELPFHQPAVASERLKSRQ